MNILFVGGGGKGTWQMRGRQLAAVIAGARAVAKPQPADWRWADVVVLVKRAAYVHAVAAKASGKPLVWDVLDIWDQPQQNHRPIADVRDAILRTRDALGLMQVIGATRKMAADLDGVYVPHHTRIGLVPTAPRDTPAIVAYEGSPRYLGPWQPALETACAARGLMFVVNPPDLTAADVLVAFRSGVWDGAICRAWKSGVKYANAIAAGRPIVTQPSAAFEEIHSTGVTLEDHAWVGDALDSALSMRRTAYNHACLRAGRFELSFVSAAYAAILASAARRAA